MAVNQAKVLPLGEQTYRQTNSHTHKIKLINLYKEVKASLGLELHLGIL